MKWFLKIIKWVVYIFAGLLLLVFTSLMVYRFYLKNSTKIKTTNGINSLEEIVLGNLKQCIFIRGMDTNNPVLIFLHGGPGAPSPGMSSSRTLDAELIKHFTVVHWDQRGAGKSYSRDIPVNSMTYDRLVEDCNELIDYLRNRFKRQKVFVVGHSSGSIIGIKTTHKYPEKIHAYVGVGQIINEYEGQKIAYDFIIEGAKKFGDVAIKNKIKNIGPPPYDTLKKLNAHNKYVFRYGGVIHRNRVKQMGVLMLSFLTSPEYSLMEGFKNFMMKGYDFTMETMWEEVNNVNLNKEIQSLRVPVYFFEGKYDMATPTILVKNFFDNLDAKKGKKLIIFENSAHMPMMEENEKYQELLINLVLKECQNR
jgi:pimeloyl-ACP methyl ester carboxylesterase